ncbi:hypothetical protein ACIQU5_17735 [Streptomyces sp. NPDC090306]|uniref:hypothetical protein n=1 Tax=Streptomyces sp. NPDC090306 TaxID=3365961 RepID=UPI0038096A91
MNDVLDGIRSVSVALNSGPPRILRSCLGLLAGLPNYVWSEKPSTHSEGKP